MIGAWCAGQAAFCGAPSREDQTAVAPSWTWVAGYAFRCEQDAAKGGLQIGCWKRNNLVAGLQQIVRP